jgi:TRAP transporter 4TM/12TM fusion protein
MNAKNITLKASQTTAGVLALITGIFHILNIAGLLVLSTMIIRIFHLMMMMAIAFLIRPTSKSIQDNLLDYSLRFIGVVGSVALGIYMLTRWEAFATSGGLTVEFDLIISVIIIAFVLEAARRSVGYVIAIVAIVFLIYPFVGPYLPGILNSRRYTFERIFTFLSISSEGIYGIPIGVSATYIVMFCMYGSFLNEFGVGDFLYKLSRSLTRNATAAPAKTAVVFSGMTGMISGSAAGNVAITGVFTIPMMKKAGYQNHEAGAVEAVASTGGQIMPPIMGAAAFIMAEIIGKPYVSIMKAAVIPAILYFTSIFLVVHLIALKRGLKKTQKDTSEILPLLQVFKEGWLFVIPIIGLIVMLLLRYSPFKSAFYSILSLLVVYPIAKRGFSKEFLTRSIKALQNGVKSAVPIATACAAAGIIAGILSVTGLGSKLSTLIVRLSQNIPLLALVLTMITSIILGMGLPTTAAYIILAAVVAPPLVKMGVPLITAHMFVFFYGCISTITPPVALAAYVAAGIADADINKVGWTAFRFGLTSYILPFMFYYGPALFLEGSAIQIIQAVIMALIGVFAIASGIVGYFRIAIHLWLRLLLIVIGVLMIYQGLITDLVGIVVLAAIYLFISLRMKRANSKN